MSGKLNLSERERFGKVRGQKLSREIERNEI